MYKFKKLSIAISLLTDIDCADLGAVEFILQSVALMGILNLAVTCMFVMDGFDLSIGSPAMSSLMLLADVMVTAEMPAVSAVVLSNNAYQPLLGCKNPLFLSMKHR